MCSGGLIWGLLEGKVELSAWNAYIHYSYCCKYRGRQAFCETRVYRQNPIQQFVNGVVNRQIGILKIASYHIQQIVVGALVEREALDDVAREPNHARPAKVCLVPEERKKRLHKLEGARYLDEQKHQIDDKNPN